MDLKFLKLTKALILEMRALTLFSSMGKSLTCYCQLRFVSIFTNRYLTFSVEYSLLPRNFTFKSPLNFFCLDTRITVSVFYIE